MCALLKTVPGDAVCICRGHEAGSYPCKAQKYFFYVIFRKRSHNSSIHSNLISCIVLFALLTQCKQNIPFVSLRRESLGTRLLSLFCFLLVAVCSLHLVQVRPLPAAAEATCSRTVLPSHCHLQTGIPTPAGGARRRGLLQGHSPHHMHADYVVCQCYLWGGMVTLFLSL